MRISAVTHIAATSWLPTVAHPAQSALRSAGADNGADAATDADTAAASWPPPVESAAISVDVVSVCAVEDPVHNACMPTSPASTSDTTITANHRREALPPPAAFDHSFIRCPFGTQPS